MKPIKRFIASILLATPIFGADRDLPIELDPYVVTGTKTVQRTSESVIRTDFLSASNLASGGGKTLADSIESLSGVRIESNCQNCGTSEILLLGLDGKYSSLLIDGSPLYSGLASVYGLEQIPTLFIDRIEVVKGAGSAMYGGGAIGGLVNVISRQPYTSGLIQEFRYDSIKGVPSRQYSAIADYVNDAGTMFISVYGLHGNTEPVDLNGDGFSELTKRRLTVGGLTLQRHFERDELRLDFNYTTEFRRGGDRFEFPDELANISERIDTKSSRAILKWKRNLSSDINFEWNIGFVYTDRDSFYGGLFGEKPDDLLDPESAIGAGDNDQPFIDRGYRTYGEVALDQFGFTENFVFNSELQVNAAWDNHLSSFGIQYSSETVKDIVPVSAFVTEFPVAEETARGDNYGIYVQDDWRINDKFKLLLGLRLDKNSELNSITLSPRISTKYIINEEWVIRSTLGTGFRAPQAFDEDLHVEIIAGDRTETLQADNLEEEKSYSGLINLVWTPLFAQGNFALETTLFYTRVLGMFTNSQIITDPGTGNRYRERFNGPDAEVGGVEVNMGWTPIDGLRVDLGFVQQFSRYNESVVIFDDGINTILESAFLERPEQYGVLELNFSNNLPFDLNLNAIYTGSMKVINERTGILNEHTESFVVFNASLSKKLTIGEQTILELSIGIKNITDDRQGDLELGVHRDPNYIYGPRTPRTLFMGAKLSF